MNMVKFPNNLRKSIFFDSIKHSIPSVRFFSSLVPSPCFYHFPITSIGTVIVFGGMQASLSQAW